MEALVTDNFNFAFGNAHHIAALLLFLFLITGSIVFANRYCTASQKQLIGHLIAWAVSGTMMGWLIIESYLGKFSVQEDLPLYLCSFMAISLPIFSITRSFLIYEIIVFWILGGTIQAIITPDLYHNFPHYNFIKYWMGHAGLVWMVFYATFVYNYRPTVRSIFKSFAALQVFFVSILVINTLLDANYCYLNHKPTVSSIMDYFGDWPYYIFQVQLLVLPVFGLIYLPFHFTNKKRASQGT